MRNLLMSLVLMGVGNVCFSQNISYEDSIRADYMKTMMSKNAVGGKAADFVFNSKDGSESSLYAINADYILVFFNNPDCDTCEELKRTIIVSSVINDMIECGKLKLLSVCVEGETEKWKTQCLPVSWIDACDKAMSIIDDELYYLPSLPVLYLLDNKCNVIMREMSVKDIEEFFELGIRN